MDNKEKELIENARNSLLAHYSSKSTNQTAILVGLAIALFADIQVYINMSLKWEGILFVVPTMGLIIFIGLRAICRLIGWGDLASSIMKVKMEDSVVAKKYLSQELQKCKLNQGDMEKFLNLKSLQDPESRKSMVESVENLDVAPTYLIRLAMSASLFSDLRVYSKRNEWSVTSVVLRVYS
jgi:hypothetical protein